MSKKFTEYGQLNLSEVNKEVLKAWAVIPIKRIGGDLCGIGGGEQGVEKAHEQDQCYNRAKHDDGFGLEKGAECRFPVGIVGHTCFFTFRSIKFGGLKERRILHHGLMQGIEFLVGIIHNSSGKSE